MRRIFAPLILAATALVPSQHATAASPVLLTIDVTGAHSDTGLVGCALFNREDGFPFDDHHAFRLLEMPISGGHATCIFGDIPPGDYAVAVMHDENGNALLDKSFLGIPQEGFGFSTNAPAHTFSPASFDEAHFTYGGGPLTLPVTIVYR